MKILVLCTFVAWSIVGQSEKLTASKFPTCFLFQNIMGFFRLPTLHLEYLFLCALILVSAFKYVAVSLGLRSSEDLVTKRLIAICAGQVCRFIHNIKLCNQSGSKFFINLWLNWIKIFMDLLFLWTKNWQLTKENLVDKCKMIEWMLWKDKRPSLTALWWCHVVWALPQEREMSTAWLSGINMLVLSCTLNIGWKGKSWQLSVQGQYWRVYL